MHSKQDHLAASACLHLLGFLMQLEGYFKMGKFLLGFIIAWVLCHRYTHIMIANECERLGGFFVDGKTYKCHGIVDSKQDNTTPAVILEAEKLNRLG